MLNEETRRKLRLMNQDEFIDAYMEQENSEQCLSLSFDERFQMLLDGVYQEKNNARAHRLIRNSKLRIERADMHDVYYDPQRPIKREQINELASCRFVEDNTSIVLQGYTSLRQDLSGLCSGKGSLQTFISYPLHQGPDPARRVQ